MDWNGLKSVNEKLATVPIKGKDYVEVNKRVLAFREICPEGCIRTKIEHLEAGMVVVKATVYAEDGRILATGLAYEKETSSFINKTSYIENCETSAVGRALGFVGIGIDGSICSAEELENAKLQQEANKPITQAQIKTLSALIKKKGADIDAFCQVYGIGSYEELTAQQYADALTKLNKKPDVEDK